MIALRSIAVGLVFISVLAALPAGPASAQADKQQPVELREDTIWEGLVEVGSATIVESGATLLVMPGTTVRFAAASRDVQGRPKASLLVRGTLVAQGTAGKPIVFTSAAAQPAAGDWGGIAFENANDRPSRIANARIEYADTGLSGGMSFVGLEQSVVRRCDVGVGAGRELNGILFAVEVAENRLGVLFDQSSGLLVENCRIADNREGGVLCLQGSSPRLVNNEITANGTFGVSCVQGSSPRIEGNAIRDNRDGVRVELKSRPVILNNDIIGNETGIRAEKLVFPVVVGNLVSRNGVGIYCNFSGYPEIHDNNLLDNGSFSLVLGDNQSIHVEKLIPFRNLGKFFDKAPETESLPPQAKKYEPFAASDQGIVDARGNWWGEKLTAEMAAAGEGGNVSAIEDVRDKPDTEYNGNKYPRDRAAFAPWATAAIAGAGRPPKAYSGIRGKVVAGKDPVAGARVHVYRTADEGFRREGLPYSAPTGEDGAFTLFLAPGSYFLIAKNPALRFPSAEPAPGDPFGYYGASPIAVGAGTWREVTLQTVRRREMTATDGLPGRARLQGVILGPAGPLEGASLFAYADAARNFRGPDLIGPQGAVPGGTDSSGRFDVELPPGAYYLVAAKRRGGDLLGPLQPGDYYGFFDGNPVELTDGTSLSVTVQAVEKLREQEKAPPAIGGSGISGTIHDPSGAVPAGVYAYATTDPNLMIGSMPPYRSSPVAPDGSYAIDLPGGATYYVGARSGFGGPPLPGQWHGFFGAKTPMPVTVEPAVVSKGIDITVRKME
jgi:parallel beta-helix repeat protein